MQSHAASLKQQRKDIDRQSKKLKKTLREVQLLKAELTEKIKYLSEPRDLRNVNSENINPIQTHDTRESQPLPVFGPPARLPRGHQYFLIPSSAIQQISHPSYPGILSFPEECPPVSPTLVQSQAKSQNRRGKSSVTKPGLRRA